jgi:hypothetical protein
MEQNNLADAILRCAGSGIGPGQLERRKHLTNEDAINLADWLQWESSINVWRSIYLTPASSNVDPTVLAGRNPINPPDLN